MEEREEEKKDEAEMDVDLDGFDMGIPADAMAPEEFEAACQVLEDALQGAKFDFELTDPQCKVQKKISNCNAEEIFEQLLANCSDESRVQLLSCRVCAASFWISSIPLRQYALTNDE